MRAFGGAGARACARARARHGKARPNSLSSLPPHPRSFNDYRDTRPHDGYAVISGWRARLADSPLPAPFFSFTSNVDHHWATVLPPELLYECHGHMELWQCSSFACAEDLMGAGPDGAVDAGRWAAPPGYRVDVRAETRVAPADAPPAAAATHAVGSLQPHDAGAFARNHPACIRCGGAARPSVLFFDDDQWVPNKDAQGRWAAFSGALLAAARGRAEEDAPPLRVALLEIGAGGRVTTVRRSAEGLLCELERSGGATPVLIRVNPDLPLADRAAAKPYVLPILGKGLAAVRGIDAALRAAAGDAFLEPLEGLVLNSVYMGRPTGAGGAEECGAAAEGGGGVEESPP